MSHRCLRGFAALALACCSAVAGAQVAINGSVQSFDTLASTGTSAVLPAGWAISETGTGSLANGQYTAGTGSANSGDTYSFGAAASSERALGALASGSVVAVLGAELINSTGGTLSQIDVGFTTEQWRLGALNGADRLTFAYSLDATSLTTGTWVPVVALDAVSPVTTGGADSARDGNLAANRAAVTALINGLSLANGAKMWVRWSDVNDAGNDDALALDDVRFGQAVDIAPTVASTVPANNATNVALDAPITITFSEAVDATGTWFTLTCGAAAQALVPSGGPTIFTLTPTGPMPSGSSCSLTVDKDQVIDRDGTLDPMAADFTFGFTTVVDQLPTIVSTLPLDNATGVSRSANLSVVFSEAVTAQAGAFVLECPAGSARSLTVDSDDNTTFTLDPDAILPGDADCVLTVNALLVEDRDGTPDSPVQGAMVDFHTAPVAAPVVQSTVPTDGATNFAPAGDLVVSFDQPVTLAAGAFTLTCATTQGIVLTHASSGAQFQIMTSTALVAGETCVLHVEADAITSGDNLHPVADTDVDFTVASTGPGAYYASVNTSSPDQLRCTLHEVIDDHTFYPYSAATTDTWDILEIADQDPNNSGRVLDIYRNESYPKYGAGNNDYNREHTWPNSLGFANQSLKAYTDTHMLYISNDTYNSTRGNTPYGNCTASCTELVTLPNNGQGGGPGGTYPGTSNWYNGQQIFEVWNHRKGDAARAILYMAIRYEGGEGTPNLELTNNLALVDTTPTTAAFAYMGKLDDLIAWHQADPPDALELMRNEAVAGFQGNRNPFIDHPEWGTKALFESTTPAVCTPAGGGNTAPVGNDDLFVTARDTQRIVAAPGVLANDTDAQGQALTAVLVSNVQNGTLALASNGGFTYTPSAGFCGTDSFGYQARDGALNSATALVTINVQCPTIFANGFEN